ncbi:MAG: 2-dehydropantoate 2-reductase [Acidimicrobiales bacterium]|jgi:2-dehydropantoate 2-reductase
MAARLIATGKRVGVVARGAHLEAMQANGLTVVGDTEAQLSLPAAASPDELDLGPDTVVILAMKTNDTEAALDAAGSVYEGLPIFCFQNGVANEEFVRARGLRSYGCRVYLGGRILEPGVVAHTSAGVLTLGVWPTGLDEVCERVSADIVAAGLKSPLHENIQASKWGKVLANVNNAYIALTDNSTQGCRRYEESRFFLADVQEEALDILDAAGIEAASDTRSTIREQIVKLRAPGEWEHVVVPDDPDQLVRPSTWQDLHFQRGQVEIEYFNGEIVRLAAKLGRTAPLNQTLLEICEAAAIALTPPGSETTASLRAAAAALSPS